jgi:hypothetical protein
MNVNNDTIDRRSILNRLKWSLQALASPPDIQLSLYPDFVCVADELTLDFDNYCKAALSNYLTDFTSKSVELLNDIDKYLSKMSRGGELFSVTLWQPEGLRKDTNWEYIRVKAKSALKSHGWPIPNPGPAMDVFVPGKKKSTQ